MARQAANHGYGPALQSIGPTFSHPDTRALLGLLLMGGSGSGCECGCESGVKSCHRRYCICRQAAPSTGRVSAAYRLQWSVNWPASLRWSGFALHQLWHHCMHASRRVVHYTRHSITHTCTQSSRVIALWAMSTSWTYLYCIATCAFEFLWCPKTSNPVWKTCMQAWHDTLAESCFCKSEAKYVCCSCKQQWTMLTVCEKIDTLHTASKL